MGLVTSDSTDDRILLALDTLLGALDVLLALGGLDLGLALGMLLLAGLLPLGGAGDVANGLLDGTSDRVVVAADGSR